MASIKGLKFKHGVVGPNKALIADAQPELLSKIDAKFPITLSVGKGKEKVSFTITAELAQ